MRTFGGVRNAGLVAATGRIVAAGAGSSLFFIEDVQDFAATEETLQALLGGFHQSAEAPVLRLLVTSPQPDCLAFLGPKWRAFTYDLDHDAPAARVDTGPIGDTTAPDAIVFPAQRLAESNVRIQLPVHFMGPDNAIEAIKVALEPREGRMAIAVLHGLRGVGKTTLAFAYADRCAGDYRAIWRVSAQTESTMRADLVDLGVRLKWIAPDDKEEPALAVVLERLRRDGDGILLIYDHAVDLPSIKPNLPERSKAHIIITSNPPVWREVTAHVIKIETWPTAIGAGFLLLSPRPLRLC